MNLKQLEAFYWLSQLQSFQRVADHIGLTQPAVSARIAGLEDQIGAKLVDRDAPGFRLTEQGYEVAEFAERFLNLREAMAARLQRKSRRRFAVGLVGMGISSWGVPLRQKLASAGDDLLVDFHFGSNIQLQAQVDSGALDMAFLTGEAGMREIGGSFTVRYEVGWVARPDVVGEVDQALTPEDLRGLPLILYPRSSPLYSPVADYVDEMRQRPAPRHYGNSLHAIVEMLRQGFGASALALAAVERDLARGMLVQLPVTVPLAPLDVRCVHVNRSRKVEAERILELARQAAREWCAAHPRFSEFHDAT